MDEKEITVRTRIIIGDGIKVGGWLCGEETYLRVAYNHDAISVIEGTPLYSLAKNIVAEFEKKKKKRGANQ